MPLINKVGHSFARIGELVDDAKYVLKDISPCMQFKRGANSMCSKR